MNIDSQQFVHLHVHSEFSLSDGIIRIDELVKKSKKQNFSSVAITDISNLFGLIKFYRAARENGIKPIIGVEINVVKDMESLSAPLVLLVKNKTGYINLTKLVSKSYIEGQRKGKPLVHLSWLEGKVEGIIALSGGQSGHVGQAILSSNQLQAESIVDTYRRIFRDDFYLEINRLGRNREEEHNSKILEIALKKDIPLVASNDVRFLESIDPDGNLSDFEAHEARVSIQKGETLSDPRRETNYLPNQYLTSSEEMISLFSDIPEAVQNTVSIAKKCNLELELGKFYLPDFDIPSGKSNEEALRENAKAGLDNRIKTIKSSSNKYTLDEQEYKERLNYELDMICKLDFEGYFLIVADFVNWAQSNHIPVGPGRGSGAGSIVAYALGITAIDPIKYDLLFERFLNPERVSNPDFDIDFCRDGRDKVLEYVTNKYGKESVAQISTRGTMAARAVIKDAVRVLDKPYWFGESLVNAMPDVLGITLTNAYKNKEFREAIDTSDGGQEVLEMGLKLEGIARSVGTHAAGVVIAPTALTDFTPLIFDEEKGTVASQFDMEDVEAVGLVKFDFLGLKTLTIIDQALKRVNKKLKKNQAEINIEDLPLDDKKTFELLKKGNTIGIFQLESRGMREYLKQLVPNNFEDIVCMTALYRPGPLDMNMVESYIERKHGREIVTYGHEAERNILGPTYGVIIYQEQVMQIAKDLAGFSLGQADILRRAMGKKKKEEMEEQRSSFIEGCLKRDVKKDYAENLFDQIETFAGYGFNRSHSVGYALIAYQTAWLKTHYPASFMASILSCEMDSTDRIQMFVEECKNMDLNIKKPDINESEYLFLDLDEETILYGLGAIKGVGQTLIEKIQEERKHNLFKNIDDFCLRMGKSRINKRVLNALIGSGAMDSLGERASLFLNAEKILKKTNHIIERQKSGISDFFGENEVTESPIIPDKEEVEIFDAPDAEWKSLGFYLGSNPILKNQNEIEKICGGTISDLNISSQIKRAGGFISLLNIRQGKKGRFAFVTLEDISGRLDVSIWADVFEQYRSSLKKGQVIIIEGEIEKDTFSSNEVIDAFKLSANKILTLDEARQQYCKCINIKVDSSSNRVGENIAKIKSLTNQGKASGTPVIISYLGENSSAELALPKEHNLLLDQQMVNDLEKAFGKENLELVYDNQRYLH